MNSRTDNTRIMRTFRIFKRFSFAKIRKYTSIETAIHRSQDMKSRFPFSFTDQTLIRSKDEYTFSRLVFEKPDNKFFPAIFLILHIQQIVFVRLFFFDKIAFDSYRIQCFLIKALQSGSSPVKPCIKINNNSNSFISTPVYN